MEDRQLKKQVIYIFFALLVLVIGFSWTDTSSRSLGRGKVSFPKQGIEFQVEIAETESQRAQGLMFREAMPLNEGMVFVFDKQAIQRVWMKNTLIELDVIFLSNSGMIVSMLQSLKPCKQTECDIYASEGNAKYMLEVNAGVIEKVGLKIGQKIITVR